MWIKIFICNSSCFGTHHAIQANLELIISLTCLPYCWYYRHSPQSSNTTAARFFNLWRWEFMYIWICGKVFAHGCTCDFHMPCMCKLDVDIKCLLQFYTTLFFETGSIIEIRVHKFCYTSCPETAKAYASIFQELGTQHSTNIPGVEHLTRGAHTWKRSTLPKESPL